MWKSAWDHAVDDLPELRVAIQSLLIELDRAAEIVRTAPGTGHEENTGGSYKPFQPRDTGFDEIARSCLLTNVRLTGARKT